MDKILPKRDKPIGLGALLWATLAMAGLATQTGCSDKAPMPVVESVDLNRFMGSWYVIAHIPTFVEKRAHNAVETYRQRDDTTIETVFTFNKGAPDGPKKVYTATGFVQDRETSALWKMQFIWPIKAEYRIVYLADDYSLTMIGRSKRDYLWIMAREPTIAGEAYDRMVALAEALGYDTRQIRRVPQRTKPAPR